MEISNGNRNKILFMNMGQKCTKDGIRNTKDNKDFNAGYDYEVNPNDNSFFRLTLLKKPINKITLAERIIINKIENCDDVFSPAHIEYGNTFDETVFVGDNGDYVRRLSVAAYQFLHAKGYALPVTLVDISGDVLQFTEKDLVDLGIYTMINE